MENKKEVSKLQQLLKKLFTNDAFFTAVTLCATVLSVPYVIVVFLSYGDPTILLSNTIRVATTVCLAITYFSYRCHAKNVMKGMIGSVLMGYMGIVFSSYYAYADMRLVSAIAALFVIVFFAIHYIINSDRHSSPVAVYANQILCLLFAVVLCVDSVLLVPSCVNTADTVVQILMCVAQPCALFCIVCIEARLDAYRLDREKAGWTEEKGYPEGYKKD